MSKNLPDEACKLSFKQGVHDEALRLLPSLQQPAAVQTDHYIVPTYECTNVTLLHLAALHGWMDIVASLVCEYNCSSQCCDSRGHTPLHYAAVGGSLSVVQYLITEQNCDPMQCSNSGNLPLHIACLSGHIDVVRFLIAEHKYDSNIRGERGWSLLHCACQSGNLSLIQYLITELSCAPALPDNDGNLPLHIASLNGQFDVVKYLITEQKCDPNSRGEDGYTPLHGALLSKNLLLIKYLIEEIDCDLALPKTKASVLKHIYNFSQLKYDLSQLANISFLALNMASLIDTERNVQDYLSSILTTDHSQIHHGSLLCLACQDGNRDVMQYLVKELGCDPALPGYFGNKPIHIASTYGQLDAVKYLITEAKCDPHSRGFIGKTPLHCACEYGNINIMTYLITEVGCNPETPDNIGNKPIHYACVAGHFSIVKCLITEHNCDPNSQGKQGATPLHFACITGHMDIIKYLIDKVGCDPGNSGTKPIHFACFAGRLNVVKYLITQHNYSPNSKEKDITTCLCLACGCGHVDIVKYFISELHCDPNIKDNRGVTLLHAACMFGQTHAVRYLLRHMNVDTIMNTTTSGLTPVHYAELSDNSFELWKLFQPLLQSRDDYPIHTYTKTVLIGNSASGKTSLAQLIASQAETHSHILHANRSEPKVETLTAGIESHVIRSENVGNLVLYDLAGQSEYYFSQSVMMETVMQRTPAIFINLVDLSKSEDEIAQAIHYWLTFIENATFKTHAAGISCIMMVGSHIDLLSEEQIESKTTLVEDLVERRVKKLNYLGFVGMDCRKINTDGTAMFFPLLTKCRESVSSCAPPVSVYCHMLYAFLQTKLDKIACQLQDVFSSLAADEESPIPLEVPLLSKLLEDLSDKGLIIYLKNKQYVERSWVVVKREAILKDVNGVLFAPKYFRGHHSIASSTGIIQMSSLHEPFPQYDAEMLVELMTCLEFCKTVSLSGIDTNLQPLDSTYIGDETDRLLFFPSLLCAERPQPSTSEGEQPCSQHLSFGWCLGCMDYEYQFLTTRFLHVLLLRLAYTFPLPNENYSKTHCLHGLQRRCTVWTNGIAWNNNNGVRTVVEVIQQSRWVVVTMFHNKNTRPVEFSRHRSAVIRLVLDLQQELAPDLDTFECLISPSLLQQWPMKSLPETNLFSVRSVASCVLLRDPYILSSDGNNQLATSDALLFEPYHLLSPSSVCELMDSGKNDQLVSPALLSEVKECCQQPQLEPLSYLSLREHLNKMSIYAGRNPLVSIITTTCSIYCIHVLCCVVMCH